MDLTPYFTTAALTGAFTAGFVKTIDYFSNKNIKIKDDKLKLLGRLMGTAELLSYYFAERFTSEFALEIYKYYWKSGKGNDFNTKMMENTYSSVEKSKSDIAKAKSDLIDCLHQIKIIFKTNEEINRLMNKLISPKIPVAEAVTKVLTDEEVAAIQKDIHTLVHDNFSVPSSELYEKLSQQIQY